MWLRDYVFVLRVMIFKYIFGFFFIVVIDLIFCGFRIIFSFIRLKKMCVIVMSYYCLFKGYWVIDVRWNSFILFYCLGYVIIFYFSFILLYIKFFRFL